MRPAAGAGFGCDFCGGVAVESNFGGGEEVGDDDEAVALQGVEVWCGHCEVVKLWKLAGEPGFICGQAGGMLSGQAGVYQGDCGVELQRQFWLRL